MAKLPAAYISTLFGRVPDDAADGIVDRTLAALLEALGEAGVDTPAVTAFMRGRPAVEELEHPVLFALGDARLPQVAAWATQMANAGFASLVGCAAAQIGQEDRLGARDLPLLTGHGVAVASRGMRGEPLVDLPVEELRAELVESRRRLSAWAGYSVRTLLPAPTALGRAVDGLVLKEARRAGYRLVLRPGRSVDELDDTARSGSAEALEVLQYRTVRTDDSPEHLRDWVVGKNLARGLAQLRELVNRPRRLLSRLRPE